MWKHRLPIKINVLTFSYSPEFKTKENYSGS